MGNYFFVGGIASLALVYAAFFVCLGVGAYRDAKGQRLAALRRH